MGRAFLFWTGYMYVYIQVMYPFKGFRLKGFTFKGFAFKGFTVRGKISKISSILYDTCPK